MKKALVFWLRAIAVALLIMIISIAVSILEVWIYAQFVPDRQRSFYDAHALMSAPWVSGLCGGLMTFLFVRAYVKRNAQTGLKYAVALPITYLAIDLLIIFSKYSFSANDLLVYSLATAAKFAGAILAYCCTPKISRI